MAAAATTGGAAEADEELCGRGSGGDRGSWLLNDVFGPCDCKESRRSPLREFRPPRLLRPPSKLRSCWPNDVSDGRCGDGREELASLGPRSFLFRFGGIVKRERSAQGSSLIGKCGVEPMFRRRSQSIGRLDLKCPNAPRQALIRPSVWKEIERK